jgi:hypothetical protein
MTNAMINKLRKLYEKSHAEGDRWFVHNPRDACRVEGKAPYLAERREIWTVDEMGYESRVCNLPDAGDDVAQLIVTMYNELPYLLRLQKEGE